MECCFQDFFQIARSFLCSFYRAFSQRVSFESKGYTHREELTQPQVGRNLILFYRKSDLHMIENKSIEEYGFPMRIIASISVDEILLPRYLNWSFNFRGLPVEVEMM